LLASQGLTVVGVASSAAQALQLVAELQPDVTLVDIDLGGESGLDVARRLSAVPAPPPIILISTHDEQDFAGLIAASPAIGFVSKMDLSAVAIRSLLGDVAGQHA
jgi:DNA-binding NarL/FixJ family response regulator